MKQIFKKYREQILYLVFGVATTGVNIIVTYVLSLLTGQDSGNAAINATAWFFAVLFAYITNKLFVFESKSWEWKKALREGLSFFGSRVFTGIFDVFLPGILIRIGLAQTLFGVKGFLAKIIASVLVIVLNYILSKLFVFRKK